ncbi:MAG: 30S ribosomal protein S12 methylthiotransferase RimO [Calditrichaeota bacterium]|nr:30S ribosomal protein S12 methylthiotransferase RimO [Calditrichota bacterium]
MNKNGSITAASRKIHLTTLGCSKNTYDSEILLGQLKAHNAEIVDDADNADVIIINTCGFIEMAKQESIDAILQAEQLKKNNPDKKIVVCGCLSQRYGAELRSEMPAVDGFFGAEDFDNVLNFLDFPKERSPEFLYEQRLLTTPKHFAYLKISEGCNHTCAFCAIPLMRGRHRSRPIPQLVAEAEMLAKQGVKELIIISQDTTFYGLDLYKSQKISELLRALEDVDGIEWIRLHYLYPTTVQDELIDWMANSRKIVPYLDMPVQHITDNMLKLMKRGGKSYRIRQIFEQAREKIPGVSLRTTFIVGHPGETESDFAALKNFMEEMRFDRAGVFTYSHEENTSAFELDDLPAELKEERYAELMALQQTISLENNHKKTGQTQRVLIDEVDLQNMSAIGRTAGDSPEIDNEVIISPLDRAIHVGQFVNVHITDASEYELYGVIEENI